MIFEHRRSRRLEACVGASVRVRASFSPPGGRVSPRRDVPCGPPEDCATWNTGVRTFIVR